MTTLEAGSQILLQGLLLLHHLGLLLENPLAGLLSPLSTNLLLHGGTALWLEPEFIGRLHFAKVLVRELSHLVFLTKSLRTMSAFGQMQVVTVANTNTFPSASLTLAEFF